MKKITNHITLLFLAILPFFLNQSCVDDFLEQPTDAITTIDSVFSNPDNAMLALWQVYGKASGWNHGLRQKRWLDGYPNWDGNSGAGGNSMIYMFSDEGNQAQNWSTAIRMNAGNWSATLAQREFPLYGVVDACRTALIFLENADKVPLQVTPSWNWNEEFREQVKAEAKYHLAYLHFEAFRRYGGFPIMDKLPTFTSTETGINVMPSGERMSVRSVLDFIVRLCDEAIPHLPDSYSIGELGRVTKGTTMALKARTLLYAASPLYNSANPPIPFGDARDSLLCFGSNDPNLWTIAVNANKDVITWAESNGYELLDDPVLGKRESYIFASISPLTTSPQNKEAMHILMDSPPVFHNIFYISGGCIYNPLANGQASPGLNFVRDNYRYQDGTDIQIPDEGTFIELKNSVREAEPRFHATVWVPGQQFSYSSNEQQMINVGGRDTAKFNYVKPNGLLMLASTSNAVWAGPPIGFFFVKKWFTLGKAYQLNWITFRLAEFYLNYAEALNEVNPNDPEIIVALNKIRSRGGLPALHPGQATYDACFGNKDKMRQEIWRERAIELYGEEHRYFDVRRWRIAENVMGGEWKKVEIYEPGPSEYVNPSPAWTQEQREANDAKLRYRFVKWGDKVWDNKMYFYPFPQNDINKGIIVQNPNW